jgi:hypothetical protein
MTLKSGGCFVSYIASAVGQFSPNCLLGQFDYKYF